jgi:sugar phosphate isomerase/epimerase
MSWEIGLSTGIAYDMPILDVLPVLAWAGFKSIEISTAAGHLGQADSQKVSDVRRAMDDLGLRAHSLHAPFGIHANFTSLDVSERQAAMREMASAAAALETLGGRLFVVHPGGEDPHWSWQREAHLRQSVDSLTAMWADCRARGQTLVVETPLPHLLGGQPDDFAWILERLPREGVGVCLDTSHTSLGGFLFEAIERLGPRLIHVQASDNRGHTDDHLVPGEGIIDWGRVYSALVDVAYQGVFMLEVTAQGTLEERMRRAAAILPSPNTDRSAL